MTPNEASGRLAITVEKEVREIGQKAASNGVRAVNAMRNAELEVLKGKRSGKIYRKYPFKSTYQASAPGEPPARRTGNLRLHWNGHVETSQTADTTTVVAVLQSEEEYASYLEHGTHHMAPRPFVDRIKEKSAPEIERIYAEAMK